MLQTHEQEMENRELIHHGLYRFIDNCPNGRTPEIYNGLGIAQ